MAKRRQRRSFSGRKLTPDDVETILRRLEHESEKVIAEDYGISRILVYHVGKGQKWPFITRRCQASFEGGQVEITVTYDPRVAPPATIEGLKSLIQQAETFKKE